MQRSLTPRHNRISFEKPNLTEAETRLAPLADTSRRSVVWADHTQHPRYRFERERMFYGHAIVRRIAPSAHGWYTIDL
jgi:hypothetical protein